jgi:hypothetical protein
MHDGFERLEVELIIRYKRCACTHNRIGLVCVCVCVCGWVGACVCVCDKSIYIQNTRFCSYI